MEFSKEKLRQIRWLMVLAAVLVLGIIHFEDVFKGIGFVIGITMPFITGGIVAFVLNLPMRFYEAKIFGRCKSKFWRKMKRPVSIVLSLVTVALIIGFVVGTVLPQVTSTFMVLGKKIPAFADRMYGELVKLTKDYPELTEYVNKLAGVKVNWNAMVDSAINFLKKGVGDVLASTVNMASGIISGVFNFMISLIFSFYILAQKEKLSDQGKRIMSAYLPDKLAGKTLRILGMMHRNFSSFISGQCLESIILGVMFFVVMSIFRMPYAFMISVLIAFTALIPIVGAFVGCAVGAFLILIENPILAFWFIVMFLVIQQIEGNLIYPKVVGNSVGLPAIWVLMAVSVGGSLFGVAGMLFFIPLMSTVYSLIKESVNNRNRCEKSFDVGGEEVPDGDEAESREVSEGGTPKDQGGPEGEKPEE